MSDASLSYEVVHESDNSRFAVHIEDETAILDYKLFKDKVAYLHTGVPPSLEGRGIGSQLVRAGLDWAREEGLRVIPVCPFVTSYIQRHPEYEELTKR
jgi:predicted GNAT family acetyltransferase